MTVEHTRPTQDPLIASARRGDPQALQRVWESHRRWIAAVLLSYKSRADDVEDLLQEVAMTMVRKIHTVREDANLRAWLRVVAINVARASARNNRHRQHSSLETTPESSIAFDPAPEPAHPIAELLSDLSEIYREPLLLRAVRGLRSRQISEALGIPIATVDTRIARARSMLLERIRQRQHDDTLAADRSASQSANRSHDQGDTE